MEAADDDTRKVAEGNHGSAPSKNQWLGARGRSLTPPKRIITYDCEEKTVKVRRVKSFTEESDPQNCERLELPSGQSEVTIFVDPQTESKPTTANMNDRGHNNVILAILFLDRLGAFNHILRFVGLLSTHYIYIMNPPIGWSESPTPAIAPSEQS